MDRLSRFSAKQAGEIVRIQKNGLSNICDGQLFTEMRVDILKGAGDSTGVFPFSETVHCRGIADDHLLFKVEDDVDI